MRYAISIHIVVIVLVGGLLTGCGENLGVSFGAAGAGADGSAPGQLVVYSSRNERFVNDLLSQFEEETGVTVNALHAGEAAVYKIIEEAGNVQADVFISNDVGALEHLRMRGLVQEYKPAGIETIDRRYRAEDNSWVALSARTRVLMYNQDLITEEEMPKTIWELTEPKWKGKYAITRGGNSSMIGHISALRYQWGDANTAEWIARVKENAGAIMQGHGDIRRAVGAGEFAFGLVNNYHFHQQLLEPTHNNVGVIYLDQGEGEMGAVLNAAGVAFIRNAPNADNARRFLEWILLPENQREFSYASLEVPINPQIEAIGEAARITDYRVHPMPLNQLGQYWEDTRELIEKSGLDLELR